MIFHCNLAKVTNFSQNGDSIIEKKSASTEANVRAIYAPPLPQRKLKIVYLNKINTQSNEILELTLVYKILTALHGIELNIVLLIVILKKKKEGNEKRW